MSNIILGIESSCDDTSAAIISDGLLLSNVIASQKVHEAYGGVVPELASRAHIQNILPVVSEARQTTAWLKYSSRRNGSATKSEPAVGILDSMAMLNIVLSRSIMSANILVLNKQLNK